MREGVAFIKKRRCPIVAVASGPRCGYRVCSDSKEQGRQHPSRTKGTFRSFTDAQRSYPALDASRIRHRGSSQRPRSSYTGFCRSRNARFSPRRLRSQGFCCTNAARGFAEAAPFSDNEANKACQCYLLIEHRSMRFNLQRPNMFIM